MSKYTFKKSQIKLPEKMIQDIEKLNLSETNKSHAFKFIQIIMSDSFKNTGDIFSFNEKPKEYLKKVFSVNYNLWLKVLINEDIILCSNYYNPKKNESLQYAINPKYNNYYLINYISSDPSPVLCVKTFYNSLINRCFKEKVNKAQKEQSIYYKWFNEDIKSLKINYDLLDQIIIERAEKISLENLGFKELKYLEKKSYKVINIGNSSISDVKKRFMKSSRVEEIKEINNFSIIETPSGCYLDDLGNYLNKIKLSIILSYSNSLDRLKMDNIKVIRNETNNRLDTNITNMYSELLDEICRQNELIQIDLRNSQFCFLSKLLKENLKTPDSQLFQILSTNGKLYNYVANCLGVKNYSESKKSLFSLLFSSHKFKSNEKKELKKIFPTVIEWIDNFKKQNGDNQFSISLQKIESKFFIDHVLFEIKKHKFLCLTKHDSLIVRKQDYNQIILIIRDLSERHKLDGMFKSDFSKEYNKIEKVGVNSIIPFRV